MNKFGPLKTKLSSKVNLISLLSKWTVIFCCASSLSLSLILCVSSSLFMMRSNLCKFRWMSNLVECALYNRAKCVAFYNDPFSFDMFSSFSIIFSLLKLAALFSLWSCSLFNKANHIQNIAEVCIKIAFIKKYFACLFACVDECQWGGCEYNENKRSL